MGTKTQAAAFELVVELLDPTRELGSGNLDAEIAELEIQDLLVGERQPRRIRTAARATPGLRSTWRVLAARSPRSAHRLRSTGSEGAGPRDILTRGRGHESLRVFPAVCSFRPPISSASRAGSAYRSTIAATPEANLLESKPGALDFSTTN